MPKYILAYLLHGEPRRDEFDTKPELDAKVVALKANKDVGAYQAFECKPLEAYSFKRPDKPVETDE